MGLYNAVFGTSPQAPLVLALLSAKPGDFGRFRDAWFEKTADGVLRCAVHTRNGGGNRDDQAEAWDRIQAHPQYIADCDDEYDCTYATAYFSVPAEIPAALASDLPDELKDRDALVAKILTVASEPVNMADRWTAALDAIKGATVPESTTKQGA